MATTPRTHDPEPTAAHADAPRITVDLRDPRPATTHLVVLSPDLRTVVHASPGLGAWHGIAGALDGRPTIDTVGTHLPHEVVAGLAAHVASDGSCPFAYVATGLDGVERRLEARVLVPVGDDRPCVVEVCSADAAAHPAIAPAAPHPGTPHPELRAALAKLRPPMRAEVELATCLHALVRSCAAARVVAVERVAGVARVVAAAARPATHLRDAAPLDDVLADHPVVLASGRDDDRDDHEHLVLGDASAEPARAGWLADAAVRSMRARRGPTTQGAAEAAPATGPRTVVYLDDDPGSRELLVEFFRVLPALELVAVHDEAAAHRAIATHRPAVVVVDAWLGDRSVEGFVHSLLAGSALEIPSVVVLSADATASTVARFKRLGVATYLSKPIDLGHLFSVVDALARGTGHEEGKGSDASSTTAYGK